MAWDDTFGAMEDSFPAEVLTLEDIVEEIIQEETMGKKAPPWGNKPENVGFKPEKNRF